MCRISAADGASGAELLYTVQDFRRRRCFRSGIVVLCAGFQPQTVLQERNCCTLCRISAADGASGAELLYSVQDFSRRRASGAELLYSVQDFSCTSGWLV
ncbi:hypothetical protein PWYN_13625 [Paenibacillus wynnii]|uniref:Uncharacterized protein n=1 Tax=Paenibacillus wynnii TaxID=268407 RepID=A0A098MCI1_9BACL|nr:hypothetical protein PWYN_13625 [Paenibacillus wynnii]